MSIKKIKQTGEDNEGVFNSQDALSFTRIINNNADELGTSTKLDLAVHNTPDSLRKAMREQSGKIGFHTPGGPDDLPTSEQTVSVQKGGLAQIYNEAIKNSINHIETRTLPTKLTYTEGEELDLTGMVVIAVEEDGDSYEVTDYTVDIAGRPLTVEDTRADVSYMGEHVYFTITVNEAAPEIMFSNPINISGGAYVETDVEDMKALINDSLDTGDYIHVTLKQLNNNSSYDAILTANNASSCTVAIDGDDENNHMTIYVTFNSTTGDETVEVTDIVGFSNFIYDTI